ncbi:MAG: hypothetical protein V5A32_04880 [Halovenus sp.]
MERDDDPPENGPAGEDDKQLPEAFEAAGEAYPPDSGVPTITCSRCDREWELSYELDELQVGNRALEQFAMDHNHHTGHYPDGVTPWTAACRQCPAGESFLAERPARRFAKTHARHTTHTVDLQQPESDDSETVQPPGE